MGKGKCRKLKVLPKLKESPQVLLWSPKALAGPGREGVTPALLASYLQADDTCQLPTGPL